MREREDLFFGGLGLGWGLFVARHFVMRGASRVTKMQVLAPHTLICQYPNMGTPASSFKLRVNTRDGRKRFPIRNGGCLPSSRAATGWFGREANS